MLNIYDLKVEYQKNPLGLDVKNPGFSWKLRSEANDVMQKCYRLLVKKVGIPVWDSGQIESDQSTNVMYQGEDLEPCTRYEIQAEIRDNQGEVAEQISWFETGLMGHQNFQGKWITHTFEDDLAAPAIFSKQFIISKKVVSARLYVSALGIYDLTLNGRAVSDTRFSPGWTNYKERLQYQTYDITSLLSGDNHLEITVGNGWLYITGGKISVDGFMEYYVCRRRCCDSKG